MVVGALLLVTWVLPSAQLVRATGSDPQGAVTARNLECTGCVTTTDIADGAVTVAKIGAGSVATDQLHDSAVNGNKLQALSVGNGHIQDNAVHGNNVLAGSIGNGHLQNAAVHGNNIQDGSVGNNHLQDKSVNGNKIADGSVANNHLQDKSVHGNNIADGSVGNNHLLDKSVSGNKIADNSVGNGQLATLAVDFTNLNAALQGLLNSFVTQTTFTNFTNQLASPGGNGSMVDFSQVRTTTYSLYRPNSDGLFAPPLSKSAYGYKEVAGLNLPAGTYSIAAELDLDNLDIGSGSGSASGSHPTQCQLVAGGDSDVSQVTAPTATVNGQSIVDGRTRDSLLVQHQFTGPGTADLQCEGADGRSGAVTPRNIRLTASPAGAVVNQ